MLQKKLLKISRIDWPKIGHLTFFSSSQAVLLFCCAVQSHDTRQHSGGDGGIALVDIFQSHVKCVIQIELYHYLEINCQLIISCAFLTGKLVGKTRRLLHCAQTSPNYTQNRLCQNVNYLTLISEFQQTYQQVWIIMSGQLLTVSTSLLTRIF